MGIQPTELSEQDISTEPEVVKQEIAGRSPTQIAIARLKHDKIAMICLVVVILFFLIAVFAPLLTNLFGVELKAGTADDTDQFNFPIIGPPDHGFTWEAPLGLAPNSGDDNLAEWFYGARTSLLVATVSTVAATLLGVTIGLIAGFSRGWLDKSINFFIDVFLSLPFLIVALAIAPILVSRFGNQPDALEFWQFASLLIVLSLFGWMLLARLVRGEVLSLREREFVQAARVIGVPTRRILFKELPAEPDRADHRVDLARPARLRGCRGRPRLPRHRGDRQGLLGPDDRPGRAVLQHLSALSLRACRRSLPPGDGAEPPRRRRARRLRPQDSPVNLTPEGCIDQPREVGTPRCA